MRLPIGMALLTRRVRYSIFVVLCGPCACLSADKSQNSPQTPPQFGSTATAAVGTSPSALICPDPAEETALETDVSAVRSAYWDLPLGERPASCIVQLQTMVGALRNNTVEVIDVRSAEAFRRVHIQGSINLPEYAIRTKHYLKKAKLLLVNDGYAYDSLIQTCQRLKSQGYKNVSVLAGGIKAWIARENAIAIDPRYHLQESVISPHQLMAARAETAWLFMTDIEDIPSVHAVLKSDHVFPLDTSADVLNAAIEDLQGKGRAGLPVNIGIVTAEGRQTVTDWSEHYYSNGGSAFFLRGGLKDYNRYVANLRLQIAKRAQGPVRHTGCRS